MIQPTLCAKLFLQHAKRLSAASLILAFLFIGLSCGRGSDAGIPELFIVSPHGGDIRREFADAFSAWHQKKYNTPVKIQWPDVGGNGTGNIIRALSAEYAAHSSSGYDIAWGGGSATFNDFNERGFFEKPQLSDDILNQVPADIFGTPLHGPKDHWIAATMSNFGIAINKDRIAELNLPTPVRWEDIAAPAWFGDLSLADPSKSGSVRSGYEMIFQQYGWEKGWGLLTLMFANAGELRDVGSAPADDVGSAQAVAGIVIDFFGRKQMLRVGPSLVGFVVPRGGSTIDPDPIAVLKGAPHAELAAHFVEFVISPEGQRLWVFRAGTPGGPEKTALGRMAVLPSLYAHESQYMLDPADPFSASEPLKENAPAKKARTAFLGDLVKSSMVDNYNALVNARSAVKAAGDPPDLLAKFAELPSYITWTLSGSTLVEAAAKKITSDQADMAAAANAFKPLKGSPLEPFTEHMQARLKDLWRTQAAARYAAIQAAAEIRSGHPIKAK